MNAAALAEAEIGPITLPALDPPAEPFRGIACFRFIDQPIYFGRAAESQRLLRLVTMYRGVLLYGESGAGKSSLLNARFVPAALKDGFVPEWIRVQPKPGAELVVERASVHEGNQPPFLPSNIVPGDEPRAVLSCEQLKARLESDELEGYPLLVFDQFEEFITLFEIAPRTPQERAEAAEAQERLLNLLGDLLTRPEMAVKVLFAFREDYFTKLQKLFVRCRDLMDQSLRLLAPAVDDLRMTILGPFEQNAGMFPRPFSERVAEQLEMQLRQRSAGGLQNPSEVQIAALMLWRAENREELLANRKVQGLLEDYLVQQLAALPAAQRSLAVAMLSCLVTDAETRNIVSREDLVQRVAEDEVVTETAVGSALDALVRQTRLVREEFRDRTPYYQIISEFLIPWIRTQKAEREKIEAERALAQERIEAEERLARQQREAERALALERSQAEHRRAEEETKFLAEKLQRARWTRAVLGGLALMLLAGWGFAARQTWVARQRWNMAEQQRLFAEEQRELALQEKAAAEVQKENAQAAVDGARSALDQNQRMTSAAVIRLQESAAASAAAQQKIAEIEQQISGLPEGTALAAQLAQLSQVFGAQREQALSSVNTTRLEAAEATSVPGWSIYGRTGEDGSWKIRFFNPAAGGDQVPNPGDIVVAKVFVNVRDNATRYEPNLKQWVQGTMIGVVAPSQRLRVLEVRQVEGVPDDPQTRYWIRGEPAR